MAAVLAACAPSALVRPDSRAPSHPVRRVALAPLADYPGAPGSGLLAANAFKRALADAGYDVASRWDQADAVVYADLTDFAEAAPQEVRRYPSEDVAPPFAQRLAALGDGARVIIDVALILRSPAPPSETWVAKWASARVGLRVRVIEAATGADLALAWAASRPNRFQAALDYTYHLTASAAADQACAALVTAIGRDLAPRRAQIVTAAASK